MNKYRSVIITNCILFACFSVFLGAFGLAGMGAVCVVLGVVNICIALINALAKNKDTLQASLVFGGVFLLIGLSLCSAFEIRI
jgi:hypothetical protein